MARKDGSNHGRMTVMVVYSTVIESIESAPAGIIPVSSGGAPASRPFTSSAVRCRVFQVAPGWKTSLGL